MSESKRLSIPKTADVVIVGAGMAGLFCAWRLITASDSYKNKSIAVLDKGEKAGGVLQSDVVKINGTTVVGEEGAMRFDKNSMCNIVKLAGDLRLTIVDFVQNDPNSSLYYLRGKSPFTETQGNSSSYWLDRYNIPTLGFEDPAAIIANAISSLVSLNASVTLPSGNSYPTTLADWAVFRNIYSFEGFELNQWGFMPLLTAMGYGHESIKMLEDAFGFIGFYQKQSNAGNTLFALGHYAKATPQFSTIDGGLEQLATGMYQLSQAYNDVTFGFDTTVQSFEYAPSNANEFTVQYSVGGAHESTITCSDLILALPKFALEQLRQFSPPLRSVRQGVPISNLLASVDNMILSKINFFYENCWWYGATGNIGKPIMEGACFSDLPLEQVYFFPSDADDLSKPGSLTIYSSYHHTNYWEPLQQAGTAFTPVPPLSQPPGSTAATNEVVALANRKIAETLGIPVSTVAAPVLTTYKRWAPDTAEGYAAHMWATGSDDMMIQPQIQYPVIGKRLFICGEAYCDEQTWMDGALRSADNILNAYFGVPVYAAQNAKTGLCT